MKFEKLTDSKFAKFEESKINNVARIFGGLAGPTTSAGGCCDWIDSAGAYKETCDKGKRNDGFACN